MASLLFLFLGLCGLTLATHPWPTYDASAPRTAPALAAIPKNFTLAKIFANHMVIQHDQRTPVWGFDVPGSTVTVQINGGNSFTNTTDATGLWRVFMDAHGSGGPHEIDVSSTSGGAATLLDVYFGSVYICGGQSVSTCAMPVGPLAAPSSHHHPLAPPSPPQNMQFSLSAALNASAEIADAINHPLIRVFTVGQGGGMGDTSPLLEFTSIEQQWSVASPTAVGHEDFGYFSALCYLFARDVQMALGSPDLPMGMISANWGGTCLGSWAPQDGAAVAACGNTGTSGHSNLYNGLIAPLTVGPLGLDGFLWSQAECDADANNTAYYACAFPRFIGDWRSKFAAPSSFFSFQVLPAYVNDSGRFNPYSLPFMREAQLTGLSAPGGGPVYAANTIDLGDALAPHGSVHPRNKQAVAARMAAAALALVYGNTTLPYASPAYASARVTGTAGALVTLQVDFAPAPPSSGLLSLRPAACPAGVGGLPLSECAWFDVQLGDGSWRNASGVALSSDSRALLLSVDTTGAASGLAVNATRGFFSPWPVVVLYSQEGLPVLPWWEPVAAA